MNPHAPKEDTLCLTCEKACKGGCNWADRLEPVHGWKVQQEEGMMSLTVIECPEFVKDSWRRNRARDFTNEGCVRLMEAVAKRMREDYITGSGDFRTHVMNRKKIEEFIRSDAGQLMLMINNPEEVISELRKWRGCTTPEISVSEATKKEKEKWNRESKRWTWGRKRSQNR